jgi:hypothetical protein
MMTNVTEFLDRAETLRERRILKYVVLATMFTVWLFFAWVSGPGKHSFVEPLLHGLIGVAYLSVLAGLFFLPALIAFYRRHHNRLAIFVLNVFVGWTMILWIIPLVWACTKVDRRKS